MTDAFSPHPSAPRTGSIIAGKYRLEESLGAGAMGVVWRGVHVMLGHSVAVKLLRNTIATSPQGIARFEQEAKISAKLGEASRHIARVQDYGMLDDGAPFVVMELLKGEALSSRLARETTLPPAVVGEIIPQLCRALTTAHKAGVVHRDLKPGNVFLCGGDGSGDAGDGEGDLPMLVKLVDFGVAKMLEDSSFHPTHVGEVVGTPSYMSPEQLTGAASLDGRSDLWAVAAMVYRMLTGRPPFGVGNIVDLSYRIVSTEPPAPTSRVPSLPPAIDGWMAKGLAKNQADRFQTAGELSDALLTALGHELQEPSAISKRFARPNPRVEHIDDALIASVRFDTSSRWRGRALAGGGLAIAVVFAAIGSFGAFRATKKPAATDADAASAASSLSVSGAPSGPGASAPLGATIASPASSAPIVAEPARAQIREASPAQNEPPVLELPSDPPPIVTSNVPSNAASNAAPAAPPRAFQKGKLDRRADGKSGNANGAAASPSIQDQSGELWRKKDEL